MPFDTLDRRSFLQAAAGAAALAVVPGSGSAKSDATTSGRPTPQQALAELMEGHERYLQGRPGADDLASQRAELAKGQQPIAAILSCADSRVVPDFLYDQPSGRLFVVRVAGNFVTTDGQASLEYGVEVLGIPLIVVLGHTACGAMEAAIGVVKDDLELPGKLPGLIDSLTPAVRAVAGRPGDLLENATAENVRLNMAALRDANPIIGPAAASGKIDIVGGVYNIATGRVTKVD